MVKFSGLLCICNFLVIFGVRYNDPVYVCFVCICTYVCCVCMYTCMYYVRMCVCVTVNMVVFITHQLVGYKHLMLNPPVVVYIGGLHWWVVGGGWWMWVVGGGWWVVDVGGGWWVLIGVCTPPQLR